jgi:hypothetical protein
MDDDQDGQSRTVKVHRLMSSSEVRSTNMDSASYLATFPRDRHVSRWARPRPMG